MAAKFKYILFGLLAFNATNASPVSTRVLPTADNVDIQAHVGNKLETIEWSSEADALPRLENLEKQVGICSLEPKPEIRNQNIKLVVIDMVPNPEPRSLRKTIRKLQRDIPKDCLTKIGQDKAFHVVDAPSTYITEYGSCDDWVVWNASYSSLVNNPSSIIPNLIIIPLTLDCKSSTNYKFLRRVTSHIPAKLLSLTGIVQTTQWSDKTRNVAFLTEDEVLVAVRLRQPRENNGVGCEAERMDFVQSNAEGSFHGVTSSDTVQARSDSEYPAPPGGYPAPPGGYPAPPGGYPAPPGGYHAPPGGY